MQKLCFKDGLLYVSLLLSQGDKEITVDNVIVDTGASHTIILSDYLLDLDVELSDTDELVKSAGYGGVVFSAVRKKINRIELGGLALSNMKIDFGVIDPYDRVNGLLGLDFLKASNAVIDLDNMVMFANR